MLVLVSASALTDTATRGIAGLTVLLTMWRAQYWKRKEYVLIMKRAETMCRSGLLGGLKMDAVYNEMDVTFHSMIQKDLSSSKDEHKDKVKL